MAREPIPTWCFALVVVRLGHRFLLVHERKHGQRWYLPAGRVEPGERFEQAAVRETLEEAGIAIALDGVLRIEHGPSIDGARMRVLFVAHPIDDRPPKRVPDDESLEAAWVTLDELARYPLRGREVSELFLRVAAGAPVYPLSILTEESAQLD
jgi:phosphatase NudJ